MFHRRRLGVREGNAIENIVAYQRRAERGIATDDDWQAYVDGLVVLQQREPFVRKVTRKVRVLMAEETSPHDYDEREDISDNMAHPPVNYMFPVAGADPMKVLVYSLRILVVWVFLAALYDILFS